MPRLATALTDLETWQRSRRGNLWRTYDAEGRTLTLTIFGRDDGRYSWCIADHCGPAFSPRTFVSERRAIADLARQI